MSGNRLEPYWSTRPHPGRRRRTSDPLAEPLDEHEIYEPDDRVLRQRAIDEAHRERCRFRADPEPLRFDSKLLFWLLTVGLFVFLLSRSW
jgi:hypothetical protein